MRGPSPLSTQGGFSAALSARVWTAELRAYFSLVNTTTYQNQDLLVSRAVFCVLEEVDQGICWVGGEGQRGQGTLFVKQATISFDFFFFPLGKGEQLALHY